jgi:hypothetical protein
VTAAQHGKLKSSGPARQLIKDLCCAAAPLPAAGFLGVGGSGVGVT